SRSRSKACAWQGSCRLRSRKWRMATGASPARWTRRATESMEERRRMDKTTRGRTRLPARSAGAGQALPEFLVVVPVVLFLLLLDFQMVLIYRAKTVLDYAAFEAARAGAVANASMDAMKDGLIRG